jgi:hypothetical protein
MQRKEGRTGNSGEESMAEGFSVSSVERFVLSDVEGKRGKKGKPAGRQVYLCYTRA